MAKNKKNSKIVKYRPPLNLNIGMIIFAIIFVYMAFSVYTYVKKEKVQFYEVIEGNIVNDNEYTGIILREEKVQNTEYAGYINYYVREGKRASVGTQIYSIDETGSMATFLENTPEANVTLTDENLSDIKRQLSSFSTNFSKLKFGDIYDLQYTLEATVLEYVNFNALGNLDALIAQNGISFQQGKTAASGVVSYAIDGFELLQPSEISKETFDRTSYEKKITKAGERVGKDAPIYKLITSDKWSIVFPLSEEAVTELGTEKKLYVTFPSEELNTWGDFSIISGGDGASYGKLDFSQYMVQFAADRYVNFELATAKVDGLKIPVTSVTEKNFFLVPLAYMTQGGGGSESGFLKETYSDAGTTVEFVPTTIYYATDENYYIDMSEKSTIKSGDYIVKPDSQERYQLGASAPLQGVYNINKGYAVFKQIEILKSNNEYYTIEKGMRYGLSVYDHIVLDANLVYEGQLIYQ